VATPAQQERPRVEAEDSTSTEFAAMMLAAGQLPVAPAQSKAASQIQDLNPVGLSGKSIDGKALETTKSSQETTGSVAASTPGQSFGALPTGAAENMQARVAAAQSGMNAGATVAGLQQRSLAPKTALGSTSRAMLEGTRSTKEWVFDGVEGNPNLRSLFQAQTDSQTGSKTGSNAVKAGENLSDEISAQAQVRGDSALGTENTVSAPTMTLSQETTKLQSGDQAFSGPVTLERAQPSVVRAGAHADGSSSLSGGEYLSTLSALSLTRDGKASSSMTSQGQGEFGSFNREEGKSGFQAGVKPGELKKTKGFDPLAKNEAQAASVSGSAMLNGARMEGTHSSVAKPAEGQSLVQAQVTTGSMSQDRIASASLAGISSNIRNFTAQGGGEMRVKLHPENLGELHLRVVTDGKQVGLQIHASDDKARKILEESLSDLKDSLSKHQLSLGQVEFSVSQAQGAFSSDLGNDSRQNPSQSSLGGNMQDMMNSANGGFNQSQSWGGGAGAQDSSAARDGWNSSSLRTAMPNGRNAARVADASLRGGSSAGGVATRRLDIRA
jgi:flagellar hook-length control protein FliK